MALAKAEGDVSTFSELERFVETLKQEFPNTKLKVYQYFSDLKYCLTKVVPDDKFRDACEKLFHGFPSDRQCHVKHYLKIQVFQDREAARKKTTDGTPVKGEELKSNKVLSLEEQVKTSQQTIQKLEKEKKDVEEAYKKSCVHYAAEKMDLERNFNDYIHQEEQLMLKLQSDFNQLQKSKEMVEDKLRKTTKESAELMKQFQQHTEDNARQKQKLSEEVHRLHRDNKELKSRVSELAGANLMDNNPDTAANLSDPNRALKLGEKFLNLYDDDWTDAYQTYTEKFNMKEDEAILFLLQVLLKSYEFCRNVADEQMDCLCKVFENPCKDIPKVLTMKLRKEKMQVTQMQYKDVMDLRKQIGLRKSGDITKQFISEEYEALGKGDMKLKSMLDETKGYYEKCAEVCWQMVLLDPPVKIEYPIKPGVKIDTARFRLYGGSGEILDYVVWPPVVVVDGGLLAKGVAKAKKNTARAAKKP